MNKTRKFSNYLEGCVVQITWLMLFLLTIVSLVGSMSNNKWYSAVKYSCTTSCDNEVTMLHHQYQHDSARASAQTVLLSKGMTDEDITELTIKHDGGYLWYIMTLTNNTKVTVYDDGTVREH
jgi:hypothetical protein